MNCTLKVAINVALLIALLLSSFEHIGPIILNTFWPIGTSSPSSSLKDIIHLLTDLQDLEHELGSIVKDETHPVYDYVRTELNSFIKFSLKQTEDLEDYVKEFGPIDPADLTRFQENSGEKVRKFDEFIEKLFRLKEDRRKHLELCVDRYGDVTGFWRKRQLYRDLDTLAEMGIVLDVDQTDLLSDGDEGSNENGDISNAVDISDLSVYSTTKQTMNTLLELIVSVEKLTQTIKSMRNNSFDTYLREPEVKTNTLHKQPVANQTTELIYAKLRPYIKQLLETKFKIKTILKDNSKPLGRVFHDITCGIERIKGLMSDLVFKEKNVWNPKIESKLKEVEVTITASKEAHEKLRLNLHLRKAKDLDAENRDEL